MHEDVSTRVAVNTGAGGLVSLSAWLTSSR